MQAQIDQYKLSPANELLLKNRMTKVDELQKNIDETRNIFTKYIEQGREMCQNVAKLAKNFETCIGQDKSLSQMINILSKFESILTSHYNLVQTSIINQIDRFSSDDIKKTECDGKNANQENHSFSKLLDSYVSIPIKKRSQNQTEFNDLETKLIAQNWVAIKSNFSFARSLRLIERKRVLEMTSYFIIFISNLGQSFRQCAQIYNQSYDNFNIIQQALPSTANELSEFRDRTSILELTLQKVFNITFKSFNAGTIYTPSNELNNEGFLWFRDQKWKKWKKRYCILKYGNLSAYKVKDGVNPVSTYKLLLSTVKPIDDSERPSCFTIISAEFKQLIMQALTPYERDKWINIIQNNIEWLLNSTGPAKSPVSTSINNLVEDESNQNLSIISKIIETPMNAICADCGAKAPTWVCINWGTVICIHCSGVHRSLTTLVSKVRSTTLDRMDDVTLELFKIIGNSNANAILEECLDKGNGSQSQTQGNQPQFNQIQQNQHQSYQQQQQPYQQHYQPYQQNQQPYQQPPYQQQQAQHQPYQYSQQQAPLQAQNSQPISNINPQANPRTSPPTMMNRPMTQSQQYGTNPLPISHNPVAGSFKITKIGPEASKEARQNFITQKYKNLAFVKSVQVDVEASIRNKDIISVFRSICTRQISQFRFALHLAASCGDPLMCRLIALNVEDPNIANNGWTALSYASYHGQLKAAQTLLNSGCSPDSADKNAHPYRIAMLKHDEEMAAVFFPYWDKSQITGQLDQPPIKYA